MAMFFINSGDLLAMWLMSSPCHPLIGYFRWATSPVSMLTLAGQPFDICILETVLLAPYNRFLAAGFYNGFC